MIGGLGGRTRGVVIGGMNAPQPPFIPNEEQLLKGQLQLIPDTAGPESKKTPPELAVRYCHDLLGQQLVPGGDEEGRNWMTLDGQWMYHETDVPVLAHGLGGPKDTGRKEWIIETQVLIPATREEPEAWEVEVAARGIDGLESCIIKTAELVALDQIRNRVEAIYENYLAEKEGEEEEVDEKREPREDQFRDAVEADADALASAGHGSDEDYGHPGMGD